jgi:hypothetical protein
MPRRRQTVGYSPTAQSGHCATASQNWSLVTMMRGLPTYWLKHIDASAQRAVEHLIELLETRRLQIGERVELDCVPTDLVALVREAVGVHRRAAVLIGPGPLGLSTFTQSNAAG